MLGRLFGKNKDTSDEPVCNECGRTLLAGEWTETIEDDDGERARFCARSADRPAPRPTVSAPVPRAAARTPRASPARTPLQRPTAGPIGRPPSSAAPPATRTRPSGRRSRTATPRSSACNEELAHSEAERQELIGLLAHLQSGVEAPRPPLVGAPAGEAEVPAGDVEDMAPAATTAEEPADVLFATPVDEAEAVEAGRRIAAGRSRAGRGGRRSPARARGHRRHPRRGGPRRRGSSRQGRGRGAGLVDDAPAARGRPAQCQSRPAQDRRDEHRPRHPDGPRRVRRRGGRGHLHVDDGLVPLHRRRRVAARSASAIAATRTARTSSTTPACGRTAPSSSPPPGSAAPRRSASRARRPAPARAERPEAGAAAPGEAREAAPDEPAPAVGGPEILSKSLLGQRTDDELQSWERTQARDFDWDH